MTRAAFFLFIYFSLYQDFILVNYIGEIGRNFLNIFLPFLFVFVIYKFKNKFTYVEKGILYLIFYLISISLVICIWYLFQGKLEFTHIVKLFKSSSYIIFIFMFYRVTLYFLSQITLLDQLKVILLVLFTQYLTMLIEFTQLPNAFEFLHGFIRESGEYYRIRLLTRESSWTSTIFMALTFIVLLLVREVKLTASIKMFVGLFVFIVFIQYTLLTGSKGYFIGIVLSLIIVYFMNYKSNLLPSILMVVGITVVFLFFQNEIIGLFTDKIGESFGSSTSLITRVVLMHSSVDMLLNYPFGVGLGMYADEMLNSTSSVLDGFRYMNLYSLHEIYGYLNDPKNLTGKTFLFIYMGYAGIFFLLLSLVFLWYLKNLVSQLGLTFSERTILVYILIAAFLFVNLENKYEVWLVIAYIEYLYFYKLSAKKVET